MHNDLPKSIRLTELPHIFWMLMLIVIEIVAAVGLVGYLSYHSEQRAIQNFVHDLIVEHGDRLQSRVDLLKESMLSESNLITKIHINTTGIMLLCGLALVISTGITILVVASWLNKIIFDMSVRFESKYDLDKSRQVAIFKENEQLQTQVTENEIKLTQFLEAIPVGIMIFEPNGQPYYVNEKAQQILGKGIVPNATQEKLAEVYQVYKINSSELYPVEQMPAIRALNGETSTINDVEIHQPDKIIPLEVWGQPIYDQKGNITYAIVAFQDISGVKKAKKYEQESISDLFEFICDLELALDDKSELANSASKFVPNQFLSLLGYKSLTDVEVGTGIQREMSILFADLRNFTTLSEKMTPADNFSFINSYLSQMEAVIVENNGFIDKYIGDAIMALFNESADHAVKAGIAMLKRLHQYNEEQVNSAYFPIKIGIGINTGSLMLGTVGGQNRMDTTVISDAVNIAARVEDLTKNYQVPLLITQQTYSQLLNPSDYAIRNIDTVQVKGKSEFVTVYEVFDADAAEVKAKKLETLPIFNQALSLYKKGNFSDAKKLFIDCLKQNKDDQVAKIYVRLAEKASSLLKGL